MTTELERFIDSFKSEKQLRETLVTLLNKMPNVTGARDTHGPLELGKDIVFYRPGGMDEKQLFACVVKNDKISGSASDANSGARNVLIQAEQALDSAHVNERGGEEFVEHVYIISPYDCPPTSMASVKGRMQQRRGQVTFYCGTMLFELFQKYWHDYFFFESEYLSQYLASLRLGANEDAALINILFRHGLLGGNEQTMRIHIPQNFTVYLQHFSLIAFVWPDAERLSRKLSSAELNDLIQSVEDIAMWLPLLQNWFKEDPFGAQFQELAGGLKTLAGSFRRAWANAYQVAIKAPAASQPQLEEPQSVKVKDKKTIHQLTELLAIIEPIVTNFKAQVTEVNRFVGSYGIDPPSPDDPLFASYSRLQEITYVMPHLLEGVEPGRLITYPTDYVDGLDNPILIVGPAGYGKTSYCRVNTVRDIERITTGESRRIPIYVPLFRLAQGPIGAFEETFFQTSELQRFLSESSNKEWSFRLYLDGLDEVPQLERQREILKLVYEGRKRHLGLQVVMTARDYVIGPHLAQFSRLSLAELNDSQIRELVSKWLNHDEELITTFFTQLSNVPSLEILMRAPLLATLIIAVFRNPRLKKLPESKVRLYELFVELHCGGWDAAKNISRNSMYGSTVKLKILTRLAGVVHYARQRDFELSDLRKSIRDTFTNLVGEINSVLDDLLQDGLITRAGNKLAFAHLSFQEYLAAKDLFDPTGHRVTQALKWFLSGDDWWREVLGFYVGVSTKPKEIETWIFNSANSIGRNHIVPASIFDQPISFLLSLIETYFPGFRTKSIT